MCKKLNNTKISNTRIDQCIRRLINTLNSHGVQTVASCCGHGKYPMTIIFKPNKGFDYVCEMLTGEMICRKRKFYKRDKQGYYYIPETIEDKQGAY